MGYIHSASDVFEVPSVIRLRYDVRRPFPVRRLTRREAFLRDRYRCQYCGAESRSLTLDHVVPRVRGGRHDWTNVVAACMRCNHRKGRGTPAEAGMVLLSEPKPWIRPLCRIAYYEFARFTHMKVVEAAKMKLSVPKGTR